MVVEMATRDLFLALAMETLAGISSATGFVMVGKNLLAVVPARAVPPRLATHVKIAVSLANASRVLLMIAGVEGAVRVTLLDHAAAVVLAANV